MVVRVLVFIFGDKMLVEVVEYSVMLQIIIITIVTLINSAKIYFFVPNATRQTEAAKDLLSVEDRGT